MTPESKPPIRICYLLCYRDPGYTRTATLLNALKSLADVELDVIINRRRGLLRYLEVLIRLIRYRGKNRPDVFLVGFRGHESFWLFYPFLRGSRILFDEFVNLHNWLFLEHPEKGRRLKRFEPLLDGYMKWLVSRCDYILQDTEAHARIAAEFYQQSPEKFPAVPVGADETLFYPRPDIESDDIFTVFFYGTLLPLHGIDIILSSFLRLSRQLEPGSCCLELVGGEGDAAQQRLIEDFISANELEDWINYRPWVDYERLPERIARADLCLGGPFGDTSQASAVITGKTYQFLAMGRATVVSLIEGSEFFQDRENVLLCERGSVESLVQCLVWAFENRQALPEIGGRGRELFTERFASAAIAKRLSPLLAADQRRTVR